jgi:hypothetical protein
MGSDQKHQFAKNEPPCYNDQRNQSLGAAVIICLITKTAYMQILSYSCPENYREDVLWPKKSPMM